MDYAVEETIVEIAERIAKAFEDDPSYVNWLKMFIVAINVSDDPKDTFNKMSDHFADMAQMADIVRFARSLFPLTAEEIGL